MAKGSGTISASTPQNNRAKEVASSVKAATNEQLTRQAQTFTGKLAEHIDGEKKGSPIVQFKRGQRTGGVIDFEITPKGNGGMTIKVEGVTSNELWKSNKKELYEADVTGTITFSIEGKVIRKEKVKFKYS